MARKTYEISRNKTCYGMLYHKYGIINGTNMVFARQQNTRNFASEDLEFNNSHSNSSQN